MLVKMQILGFFALLLNLCAARPQLPGEQELNPATSSSEQSSQGASSQGAGSQGAGGLRTGSLRTGSLRTGSLRAGSLRTGSLRAGSQGQGTPGAGQILESFGSSHRGDVPFLMTTPLRPPPEPYLPAVAPNYPNRYFYFS